MRGIIRCEYHKERRISYECPQRSKLEMCGVLKYEERTEMNRRIMCWETRVSWEKGEERRIESGGEDESRNKEFFRSKRTESRAAEKNRETRISWVKRDLRLGDSQIWDPIGFGLLVWLMGISFVNLAELISLVNLIFLLVFYWIKKLMAFV